MAIAVGTTFGSIEITGLLGKGGMGEVYRARDLKLKREVAIKLLPDEFLRDADRVSRFQREAEVLASLNHPNIAAIHSIEEENGSRFLVLELVEGDTLADRIARGPLPVAEALQVAKSICEALESAHEKGVIHRDLKPANVKVTPDGNVKVLDFGLAKALENTPAAGNLSQSPTMTSPALTQMGMILGTAAYMSPEQAKGLNTDQRSDIFSFGAVLFEMVTGRQAFQGDSVSDVLASILAREPDLGLLPPNLHPRIVELLRRSLEKNPKRRWHAIGDVRVELESALADPRGTLIEAPRVMPPVSLWKRLVPILAAVMLTAAATTAAMWYLRPTAPQPISRWSMTLPEGQQFTNPGRAVIAVSPDGTQLVYNADSKLQYRALSEPEDQVRPLDGMDGVGWVSNPVFSPDGRSIVFYTQKDGKDGKLEKLAVGHGVPEFLCSADNPYGISWNDHDIVFGQGEKGILRVSEKGGTPELLVSVNKGEWAHGPQILPGGKYVLYTVSTGTSSDLWDKAEIFVQSLDPGSKREHIIRDGADARYVPTGHIVYASGGTLFAVPFDLGRHMATGTAVKVIDGVRRSTSGNTGAAHFSFSSAGSLFYIPGPASTNRSADRTLATLGPQGGLERLNVPPKAYAFARASPDGNYVAVSTDDSKDTNVWIVDIRPGGAAPRPLTSEGINRYPVWLGNESVAYQSDREGDLGIFRQKADGSELARRLTRPGPGVAHIPDSWSRDGYLSFTAVKGVEGALKILSLKDGKETVFAEKPGAFIGRSAFSPKTGQWLAYQSDGSGVREVWVQPFPTGSPQRIAPGGHPFWLPEEQGLVFNPGPTRVDTIQRTTGPGFAFKPPESWPGGLSELLSRDPTTNPRVWDVLPDGRLIGVAPAAETRPQINVVLNWFEELKGRMSTP